MEVFYVRRRARSWVLFATLIVGLLVTVSAWARFGPVGRWLRRQPLWGTDTWISSWPSATGWLTFLLVGTGLLVLLKAFWARRSVKGPVSIGTVLDTTGAPGLDQQVASILRDRLARAGVQPLGIVPSYPGLSLDTKGLAASSLDPGGALIRVLFRLAEVLTISSPGWRVDATLRRSPRTGQFGLTFVVEHISTGRHDLVRTIWAEDALTVARQTAYEIAAWHQGRLVRSSSRVRPRWRPTATALSYYEDAVFCAAGRRFDNALDSARAGLGADPSNLELRRVLGETYERLGHYFSALHTYSTGIEMLLDGHSGWIQGLSPRAEGRRGRRWPQSVWGRRVVRSDQAASLIWRYTVVLTFADQWVDRWIADLERAQYEEETSAPVAEVTGRPRLANRWSTSGTELKPPKDQELAAQTRSAQQQEWTLRFEEARQIRGLFARRYKRLLRQEFPLLNAVWFAESEQRRSAFHRDPVTPTMQAPEPAKVLERLRQESARFGLREGRVRAAAQPEAATDWLIHLRSFYAWLDKLEQREGSTARDLQLGREPETVGEVLREAHQRLGSRPGTGAFARIAESLEDPEAWNRLREAGHPDGFCLDRQLVASAATWAGHQLLRLNRHNEQTQRSLAANPKMSGELLSSLLAQLDMRYFVFRAALQEMDRLRRRRDVASSTLTPWPLRRLLRLKTRFTYLERLHELHAASAAAALPERSGNRHHRERRVFGLQTLRRDTARQVRRTASPRAARVMAGGQTGAWNLWYYAACTLSILIEEPPSLDGPAGARLDSWTERNGGYADSAIRALNEAILVRRPRDLTAVEAGAKDWLLFEDPDLDRLRAHPGFRSWASVTFGRAYVDQESSPVDRWQRRQRDRLRGAEWCNDGAFGLNQRWGPGPRLFWLANDHHLWQILTLFAPMVAHTWLLEIQRLDPLGRARQHDRSLIDLLERDDRAWRRLMLYRRFAARPELRLALIRDLDALISDLPRPDLSFPTSQQVLTGSAAIDYDVLDALLGRLVREAHQDLRNLRSPSQIQRLWPFPATDEDLARRAQARWTTLTLWVSHLHVSETATRP